MKSCDNPMKESAAHERGESPMKERAEERQPDGRSSPGVPPEERAAYDGQVPQEIRDSYKR